jgi:hypothetical protein
VRVTIGIVVLVAVMVMVSITIITALPPLVITVVMSSPVIIIPVFVLMGSALFIAPMVLQALLIPEPVIPVVGVVRTVIAVLPLCGSVAMLLFLAHCRNSRNCTSANRQSSNDSHSPKLSVHRYPFLFLTGSLEPLDRQQMRCLNTQSNQVKLKVSLPSQTG